MRETVRILFLRLYAFTYASQYLPYTVGYLLSGTEFIADTDKSNVKMCATSGNSVGKSVFIGTISLTDLTLHAVAVNSMTKSALRDAYKYRNGIGFV